MQTDKETYTITCSGRQAMLLMLAAEMWARISAGQFKEATNPLKDIARTPEQEEKIQDFEDFLRNNSMVLDKSPSSDLAWDMYQVIRHRLTWDRANNPKVRPSVMVDFDEPFHTASEPFLKIERVGSQKADKTAAILNLYKKEEYAKILQEIVGSDSLASLLFATEEQKQEALKKLREH